MQSQKATLFVRGIRSDPLHSLGVEDEKSEILCLVGGDMPVKVRIIFSRF